MPSAITTDAVVIGAGPVGLFQVFELGLLDIRAHVIDALPYVGGQPVELYPDKPIYDIPAVPVITGQGLAEALMAQIKPFQPTFHLGQQVTELQQQDDGRFFLRTSTGTTFLTRTVFIAAGVGAFQPRKLKVAGLDAFEGSQVFYRVQDPQQFAGKNLVIVGGGDSALDWTLQFVENQAHQAESVILVHRREGFRAAPASVARMQALCADLHMQFMVGQITGFDTDAIARAATQAARHFGYTRMWSIHPSQIRPILAAFAPGDAAVQEAAEIIEAAHATQWAPISHNNRLHDRASFRYFWQLLERAHATGKTLPTSVQALFAEPVAAPSAPPAT